ncbi:6-phospho-beta-glucosidase [Evansella caseinilytica]|uniref:6-phospho-beta-glucosidase n=1 Tax=Evansella caseinilytica TaxID=1503961 RepID=A0A1H3U3U2_9BACI|nr:glycoside hydrolase family 1 protein [Evansella caseinilytica]SDZ57008.1 6-phospho-beta-glucosidase [Evansella caseinilytica]
MNNRFPDHFLWGAAASGPQLEGAGSKYGKGKTVWDYWFETEPEKFYQQIGPETTSSFYSRYKEDILLMKDIGFNSFRTSISWARLLPDGTTINQEAVTFYRDVFSRLRENGIKPIVNLYHFDMPYRLHKKGGWENRETVEEFYRYAKAAFQTFGDLVNTWVTFNEPIVPVEMGYLNDKHLPAVYDLERAARAAYFTLLAHGKAVSAFRELANNGEIGIILNLTPSYPKSDLAEDREAAKWADILFNRSFLDPVVFGKYPVEMTEFLAKETIDVPYTDKELVLLMNNTVDFLGVNYYQPRRVQAGDKETGAGLDKYFKPYHWPKAKINPHRGWEIYEKGLYDIALNIRDNYRNIPWYVAENGIGVEGEEAFLDEHGEVQDDYRIHFMADHLRWLQKGMAEGANCFGYHVWTFLDNWSWLNEYKNRYGLLRLDLATQTRTKKKSAQWFKQVAETNQLPAKW